MNVEVSKCRFSLALVKVLDQKKNTAKYKNTEL